MTRTRFRRTARLENLESRQLLTGGGPSPQQQYMLELLNLARTNPASIAEKVTSDLDANVQATVKYYQVDNNQVRSAIASVPAKPPLAWNSKLADAAQGQSQDQANTGTQSHDSSDGSSFLDRLDRVGYNNRTSAAENAFAYSTSIDEAMQAFLIDWGVPSNGHRNTILEPATAQEQAYRDVGIGIVNTKSPSPVGPIVITQNFGAQAGSKAQLLGVVYDDAEGSDSYDPGEGRGDVTIEAVNEANGQSSSVQTWDSGGYQIPLDPGTYKVTAKVGGQVVRTQDVNINNLNVKVDYDLSDPWQLTPRVPNSDSLAAETAPAGGTAAKAEPVVPLKDIASTSGDVATTAVAVAPSESEVATANTESGHTGGSPHPIPAFALGANWRSWGAMTS